MERILDVLGVTMFPSFCNLSFYYVGIAWNFMPESALDH